ncbi:hypothetical protein L8T02_21315 [Enterobacter chengduensis]|uniref:hypothetical protein n=1 Tax=Enterobacter chengduensis TaxID=2494701 RepID=UPI002005C3D5|nr:hypothetical protein [Enterobacter chengduensis]MCK6821205.1 hypothetical protein [Enterobacter chengduensis]
MGFPSPATDYQEQRITIDLVCGIDGNCRVIETSCGWAVINVSLKPERGDTLLVSMDGRNQFVKLMGQALITQDGEAIEGEALNDVMVYGVLTHTLDRVSVVVY